ncbi:MULTISPECIES: DsbA family oxidoreductase [unclassified Rathayibacter]|uniref:DsbA family oxidoreductase n=1 Tax=unclassified Rathayibacter TaxID=2609250 RepID=UPI0007017D0B|nr:MULTISPECIES: DsbA family oxidoreductase [unclassified Rathayibacter]KQQ00779.1 disulfide bond formation protein DsbA [Rathayibacter sp. Leaf294]KQS10980.1 disulfide bond formation protein DsbA [Rathayibacter sp. Leaf185]
MTDEQTPITVDIWSDIACPWCYIGKRKFERGLEAFRLAHPEAPDVAIEYRSFELSPDTPEDYRGGEAAFLAEHKGIPEAQAQQMLDSVTAIAASVGLDYHFETVRHVKTVTAHQVLHHAKEAGLQLELKERLLRAYFVEGHDLADRSVLASLAAEVGLDSDEVLRALEEQRHLGDVQSDIAQAREYGINGVPFFVLDGRFGVSGAQEPTAFTEVLEHVLSQRAVVA